MAELLQHNLGLIGKAEGKQINIYFLKSYSVNLGKGFLPLGAPVGRSLKNVTSHWVFHLGSGHL